MDCVSDKKKQQKNNHSKNLFIRGMHAIIFMNTYLWHSLHFRQFRLLSSIRFDSILQNGSRSKVSRILAPFFCFDYHIVFFIFYVTSSIYLLEPNHSTPQKPSQMTQLFSFKELHKCHTSARKRRSWRTSILIILEIKDLLKYFER